jgi:hypothetical protein
MSRVKVSWIICMVIGIGLILSSFVAPIYFVPSTLTLTGPKIAYITNPPYWVDNAYLPPVENGSRVLVIAKMTGNGGVDIVISSEAKSGTLPAQSLIYQLNSTVPFVDTSFKAVTTTPYDISIVSSHANYTLQFRGLWARYSYLSIDLYWGGLFILAAIFLFFYDRAVESQKKLWNEQVKTGGG